MHRVSVFAFISGLFIAQTASADVIRTFTVANWFAGAYSNDQTKIFDHCAASSTYVTGITMLFAINRQYQWSIGFANRAWTLTPGATFDVAFAIDNDPPIYGRATALNGQQVEVQLADSVTLFQRFRRGYQLKVFTAGQVLPFNLTDSSQILPVLLQCVGQYVNPPQQALLPISPFVSPHNSA